MSRRTQVLTLSLPHFEYETFTLFGLPSQVILLCFRSISCESYNPDLWSVWAVPISLAATPGIDLSFFSSSYIRCFNSLGFSSHTLCFHVWMTQHYLCRVPPFGYLRIDAYFQLPVAFRR